MNPLPFVSEIEAQSHLYDSRIVYYAADFAERGRIAAQVDARVGEIHVVEQVVCFGTKCEGLALHQLEALDERSVEVEEPRAPEGVAAGTADAARHRFAEIRDLGGREVVDPRSEMPLFVVITLPMLREPL